MTLNLALIGAGRIAKVHASAIAANPSVRLAAVADAVPAAASALASQRDCEAKTVAEIAADPAINAVLICTPTDSHAGLIEQFAKAGKHVFCEKPVDLDIERAQSVVNAAKTGGVKLMLGFNRRFDPNFAKVRAVAQSGEIGAIEMVTITSHDPGAPDISYAERSGGIFRDMTIHDLDMTRFMLGEEPVLVSAHASVLVDPRLTKIDDFDSATTVLETASGKQAVITNSRRATYGYDQRVEIHGSLGVVNAENLHESTVVVGEANGYTRPPLLNFFMTRYTASYAAEIAAFIDCLIKDTAPNPSGADGVAALQLANACVQSVKEGRRIRV